MNVRVREMGGQYEEIALDAEPSKRSIAKALVRFYKDVRGRNMICWFQDVYKLNGEYHARIRRADTSPPV